MSVNSSLSFRSSLYDKFFKSLPEKEIKNAAEYTKLGHALASPHWNRLVLGCAAVTAQPIIDRYNPRVNEDTAVTAMFRSFSKAIVCTTVGFCVRGATYKVVSKYAHASEKEGSTLFTPKEILKEKNSEIQKNKLKLHKNTLSTVFALGVMLFTNFLLDAPGTTWLTNKLLKYKPLFMSDKKDKNTVSQLSEAV